MIYIFGIYLVIMSLAAVAVTVKDKKAAQRHGRRVAEKTLLLIAALGGSAGMLVTMKTIRHKTKHAKFMVGIPVIILMQLAVIAGVLYYFYTRTGSFDFLIF